MKNASKHLLFEKPQHEDSVVLEAGSYLVQDIELSIAGIHCKRVFVFGINETLYVGPGSPCLFIFDRQYRKLFTTLWLQQSPYE